MKNREAVKTGSKGTGTWQKKRKSRIVAVERHRVQKQRSRENRSRKAKKQEKQKQKSREAGKNTEAGKVKSRKAGKAKKQCKPSREAEKQKIRETGKHSTRNHQKKKQNQPRKKNNSPPALLFKHLYADSKNKNIIPTTYSQKRWTCLLKLQGCMRVRAFCVFLAPWKICAPACALVHEHGRLRCMRLCAICDFVCFHMLRMKFVQSYANNSHIQYAYINKSL